MNKAWVFLIGGVVLFLVGLLWCLQGSGSMGQTGGMNGKSQWLVIGVIVAVLGVILVVIGIRGLRTSRTK